MSSPSSPDLFRPAVFGPYELKNRIVMAPLTRSRAVAGDIPGPLAAEYYRQRASAGLIVTEATQISPQGKGYAFTPGIYNDAQVAEWKKTTDAVHEAGGRIFVQLWHVGRISHPSLQPDGGLPVAPSAVKPEGKAFTETGFQAFVTPRALELAEIPGVIEQYRVAAKCAKAAGFDGVEIHAANGYLLDQFLRDGSNRREDAYGGSVENRCRLLLEVTAAVTEIWDPQQVGVRLSPISPANDIADSDPAPLFAHAVGELNKFGLLYLHMIEGATGGARRVAGGFDLQILRRLFNGLYIGNNGYDRAMALSSREEGLVDFVAFGKLYIANPDLVRRLESAAPLNELDGDTLYGGGAKGYTDYPFLDGAKN
jgi:N-ethylmaleimide reductase